MLTHSKDILPNGLRVVTVEIPHLHSAMLALYVRVGARHETRRTNGLSHFLEHMFFRGSEHFPTSAILNGVLEDAGGGLDGVTTRDHTYYYAQIHPDYLATAFEVMGDMFARPTFPGVDTEREIVLEEVLNALDSSGRVIDLDIIAHRTAFPDHPLGNSIDGPRSNLRRFGLKDLQRHWRTFYGARNMVLCAAGRVQREQVLELARRHLAALAPGEAVVEVPPPPPPSGPPRLVFAHSDESQTRVRLSFRGLTDTDPDFPALIVLRRVLDGGLSSRLHLDLVDRLGLAYDIGVDLEVFADTGLVDFEVAVAPQKMSRAVGELLRICTDLVRSPVTTEEVARVRHRHRMALEFSLDSAADMTGWFGGTEIFHPPETIEERIALVQRVTPADVLRVARRVLVPSRLSAAAVGAPTRTELKRTREILATYHLEG